MTPRHVRTFTTGAVASVALAVTGTAVFSSGTAPSPASRIERSSVSSSPTTVAPEAGTAAGQRGQSVSSGLRDKALRTAVLTDIPPSALAAYQRAASSLSSADPGCHLPWTVLAAVGQVESNHGRSASRNARGIVGVPLDGNGVKAVADTDGGTLDGDTKHDRAVGPMQILPSTWSSVAVDGDGDGKRDPQDIDDAALGAAVYLCGSGADLGTAKGQETALRSYNNSASYVAVVMSVARSYAKDGKAQYSLGSLQTGDISLPAIGSVPTGGTDATPAKKKTKAAKTKKTKTKSSTPATTTPAPTKTPTKTPPGTATPKPGSPKPTDPAPVQVAVPDVVNQQVADALRTLHAAGFLDTSSTEVYDAATAGTVLDQSRSGTAAKGAAVALTVSAGPVANVVGQSYTAAKTALEDQGFTVLVDTAGPALSDGDAQTVTVQTPDPQATRVSKGATVTVTLTAPEAEATPTPGS